MSSTTYPSMARPASDSHPMPSVWRFLPHVVVLSLVSLLLAFAVVDSGSPSKLFPKGPVYILSAKDPYAVDLSRHRNLIFAPTSQLADSLAKYASLPPASIAVTLDGSDKSERGVAFFNSSSYSRPSSDGKRCLVDIQIDDRGMGALARSIIGPALHGSKLIPLTLASVARLNEFEALHELGHCAHASMGKLLDLPGVTPEESRLASLALSSHASALSKLHGELFADAYAAHRYLAARRSAPEFSQAVLDMRLIAAWRAAETQLSLARKMGERPDAEGLYANKARVIGAPHATGPLWESILSDPATFASLDLHRGLPRLVSELLVRCSALSTDSEMAAADAFGASEAIADILDGSLFSLAMLPGPSDIAEGLDQLLAKPRSPLHHALRDEREKLSIIIWKASRASERSAPTSLSPSSSIAEQAMLIPSVALAARHTGLSPNPNTDAWAVWEHAMVQARKTPTGAPLWPKAGPRTLARAIAASASNRVGSQGS